MQKQETYFDDSGTDNTDYWCMSHNWHLESLRGTNCHQRVEHIRCLVCHHRRTRVWMDLPKQGRPDREHRKGAA